jgi:hypothetical protein
MASFADGVTLVSGLLVWPPPLLPDEPHAKLWGTVALLRSAVQKRELLVDLAKLFL